MHEGTQGEKSDAELQAERLARIQNIRGTGKLRRDIALVDDDEGDYMVAAKAVEACGYKVVGTRDGSKVTRLLSNQKLKWLPEAVMISLVLNGSSGFEVIRLFKERFGDQSIPFLVISKFASEIDIHEAQMAGADAFVIKPFGPLELLDALAFTIEDLAKPMAERRGGIYVVGQQDPSLALV